MHQQVDNLHNPVKIAAGGKYRLDRAGCGRTVLGKKWIAVRAGGALALAIVLLLSFFLPCSGLGPNMCAFRNTFGIPCPGCGLMRSFCAVSHGRLREAFIFHPLGLFIYAGFALYAVIWAAEALLGRRLLEKLENKLKDRVLWCFVFAMIAVWLIRLATGTVC